MRHIEFNLIHVEREGTIFVSLSLILCSDAETEEKKRFFFAAAASVATVTDSFLALSSHCHQREKKGQTIKVVFDAYRSRALAE